MRHFKKSRSRSRNGCEADDQFFKFFFLVFEGLMAIGYTSNVPDAKIEKQMCRNILPLFNTDKSSVRI